MTPHGSNAADVSNICDPVQHDASEFAQAHAEMLAEMAQEARVAAFEIPWRERRCEACQREPVKGPGARFCSDQCRVWWHWKINYRDAELHRPAPAGPRELSCAECGEEFTALRRIDAKYCSGKCRTRASRRRLQ